jgi:hypothetical protein
MSDEEKKQLQCLEDALSSTYRQSFASSTGLVAAAIRTGELRLALTMYKALKSTFGDCLSYFSAAKKRAMEMLDVDGAKRAEERIQEFNQSGARDLDGFMIENLKDFLDFIIASFERRCDDVEDEYDRKEDTARKELDKDFGEIELKVHLPALVTLEKQIAIAKKKEEKRASAAFPDKESDIRAMVAANDFETAQREKEKLEKAIEDVREQRLKRLNESFDEQRKKLLDRQQRDLKLLEEAFNRQMAALQVQKERDIKALKTTLMSVIRGQQQKLLTFAKKLQATKDWGVEFDKIVRGVLENRGLEDLADPPSKNRRSTPRIKL